MKLLLLDSNNLINRAYYALPMLTDKTGRYTGALFGFTSMLSKLIKSEKPTHIAAAFDLHAPTFRHLKYAEYKGKRRPMPEELRAQVPAMKELLQAMGVAIVELAGYEADDLIGTLSKKMNMETVIVSGDKDVLQLVSDRVTVLHTRKGITDVIRYTPERLAEDGLTPNGIIELKSLMGDPSDNIIGVPGVGEKTAKDLILKYSTIQNLYEHIDEIGGKLHDKLINGKESAEFSHWLATINTDVPIDCDAKNFIFKSVIPYNARKLMVGYDFKNLTDRFTFEEKIEIDEKCESKTTEISDKNSLIQVLSKAKKTKQFAFYITQDKIHFAFDKNENYFVSYSFDLFGEFLSYDFVIDEIKKIIYDKNIKVITYDLKHTYFMLNLGVDELFDADDLMLMAYIGDCGKSYTSLQNMLEVHGLSGENIAAEMLSIEKSLNKTMVQSNSLKVYEDIELPLVRVLYDMEKQGFRVDKKTLDALTEKYSQELNQIVEDIYKIAGHKFNINSTKQLAEVLYDELKLPADKKRSTSADVLAELDELHPIISIILRYRLLSKLISTYLIGMKSLIDARGRIHTVFNQALTTTGRLSSSEPNLQNIPVREAEGREIRSAFIPNEGNVLISADYSQIELRLMAHFSEDEGLIDAFNRGIDIHSATAAKVFGVKESEVTSKMRRDAKAVNFGIIYGISDFGLAKNIGSSVREARGFIEKYFQTYPLIKIFMDKSVAFAKEHGYVCTPMGRIRALPEIKSSNFAVRSFGERAAMNMPLQGMAADIIKIAMIKVYNSLKNHGLKAKIILQVHDEIIIDCPKEEENLVKDILKYEMEHVFELKVPLAVNVSSGNTWKEAK